MHRNLLGIISVDFDATCRLLIRFCAFVKYFRKCGNIMKLYISFKKAGDSVRREVFYNIHFEFVICMKLVRLMKMCLNETYSGVRLSKHLSTMFPMKNGLKKKNCFITVAFQLSL